MLHSSERGREAGNKWIKGNRVEEKRKVKKIKFSNITLQQIKVAGG